MARKIIGTNPAGPTDTVKLWVSRFLGRRDPRLPLLFEGFDGKADGTPPVLFDSQQVADWDTSASALPTVLNGYLGAAGTGARASYYRTPNMGANITEIGGRFVIFPGSATRTANGSAVLGIGTAAIVVSGGVTIDMPCHVLFSKEGWTFGVWNHSGGGFIPLDSKTYLVPLPDDGVTEYEAAVQLDITAGKATIYSPDGNKTVVTDSRITTFAGNYGFFESFLGTGNTDDHNKWAAIWCNTGVAKPREMQPVYKYGQQIVNGFIAFISGIYANAITFPTGAATGSFVRSADGSGNLSYSTLAAVKTALGLTGTNSGDQALPCDFVMMSHSGLRATGIGDLAVAQYVGRAFTLTKVVYQFDTADASGSTTVETRRNGSQVTSSSIAVTAANQVDGTGTEAARTVTINQSFAVGDRITPWITGVGTTPGRGLRAYYFGTWN